MHKEHCNIKKRSLIKKNAVPVTHNTRAKQAFNPSFTLF